MAEVVLLGVENFRSNQETLVPKLIARAKKFSWETAAKQYTEVYKSLLKK
jgi:glycogen synthase